MEQSVNQLWKILDSGHFLEKVYTYYIADGCSHFHGYQQPLQGEDYVKIPLSIRVLGKYSGLVSEKYYFEMIIFSQKAKASNKNFALSSGINKVSLQLPTVIYN